MAMCSKHSKLPRTRGSALPSSGEVRGCVAASLRQLPELLGKIAEADAEKSKLQEEVEKQRAVLQELEQKLQDAARAHQDLLDELFRYGDEEQDSGSEPDHDGSAAAPSANLQGSGSSDSAAEGGSGPGVASGPRAQGAAASGPEKKRQPKNRKSKGPPVLAAWFKGRHCGAPLTLMCKNAVDHVLDGKEIQKEHAVYAKRNATYIHNSFMMCSSENIHVVEIRRRDAQEFDAKALKKKLDCLMKNYKGVERGVVYVAGQGPSLQHCNEEASKIPWQPSAAPVKAEEGSCASAPAEQSPPECEVEPESGVEVHAHPPEQAEQELHAASA